MIDFETTSPAYHGMRLPVILAAGLLLQYSIYPAETSKPSVKAIRIFSLAINPPADAAFTEIEFSDIDLSAAKDAQKISGARVKVIRTKEKIFREFLSPEIRFFRVRSIHSTGVAGAYSQTYSIETYLRKPYREPAIPVVHQGKTEYLLGSRIELPTQPNLVTKYRLGEGEFLEYKEPIVFDRPDTYNMEVNLENAEKQVVFSKKFVFKVELNPPKTSMVIDEPVHSKRGIIVGKSSSVVFFIDDAESGVAKIYYRILPLGKDLAAVKFSQYAKRLTHADLSPHGQTSIIQFYSVDKAGNKEEVKTEVLQVE